MSELETETEETRAGVARILRDLAEQLESDDAVEMAVGGRQVRLDPVDPITLKLEAESDWQEGDARAKQSAELELVWWREAGTAAEAALDVGPTDG
jgi:amphi-Trp domain-containing protein